METHIGLDLGATNSAIAYLHPRTGEAVLVPAWDGPDALFPSDTTGYAFRKYEVADSPEVAILLLKKLKDEAEKFLEKPVGRAQLAIPDNFQPPQREALENAARQAGFAQVQLVENSHCMLHAYQALNQDQTALLLHLGSSNLEVSLCRIHSREVERLDYAHEGLGGRDWDFLLRHELAPNASAADLENAKRDLSFRHKTYLGLLPVTRQSFQELSAPLIQRCRMRIEQVLEGRPVDQVWLAGGASRMPLVAELVRQLTGRIPPRGPNPEEVLALGAVLAKPLAPLPPAPARRAEGSTVIMKSSEISQILQQLKSEAPPPKPVPVSVSAPEPTPASTQLMQLGGTLSSIQPNCWQKENPAPDRLVWRLSPDFVQHYFPNSDYDQICQDGEPGSGQWRSLVFHRRDGTFDITLRSGQAEGEWYEFSWRAGDPPAQITRWRAGQAVGQASLQSAPGAPVLIVQCPELQEQIQFDPLSLLRVDAESQRDRMLKMMPWLRMLCWFGRVQQLDPPAFRAVPSALREFLHRPDFENAIGSIPLQALQSWIQQGFLPPELEPVGKEHVQNLLQSLVNLQGLARQQPASGGWLATLGLAPTQPKVPGILLPLNPAQLDALDLQVFVTIGALASVESIFDREFRVLLARRPDLQARMRSPEGKSAILNDPEVASLRNRADIVKENANKAWKAAGETGPTPMEQGESMMRSMSMQLLTGYYFDPGVSEKRPPWKIYKPYVV